MSRRASALVLILTTLSTFAQQPLVAPTDPKLPADERKAFKLPDGFDVQLVASDPDIMKPMQIAFDAKGRLWVPTSQEYPFPAVGRPGRDKLYVLDDFGPDGKARKVSVFADDLNIPIGILPLPDGSVLVSSIDPGPEGSKEPAGCLIWRLYDKDGDGKVDHREKLYGPFGVRDTHGTVNSFTLMPDGWVYACHGYLNDSRVKGLDGHEVHMNSGNTFRFRVDGRRIEVFTRGQVNPFGMTCDPFFNLYTADCHSKPITQLIRGAVYESFGKPHDGLGYGPNMLNHDHGSTALCGLAWYDADQFPAEFKGTMFLGNVVTNRINFDKIEFVGSTPKAIQQPDFLVSDDPWFRPVDIKLGPDGALYVSDFYNKIIGHYEVDLKHPGRDKTRGRVWRIVWTGKDGKAPPPKSPGDFSKMKREDLDKLLGHPNLTIRMFATHTLINWPGPDELEDEKARPLPEVYEAHKMWADDAEPVVEESLRRPRKTKERARDDGGLAFAHRYRLRTAEVEWAADRQRRGRDIERIARDQLKVVTNGQGGRAAADWMTAVPKAENLPALLRALEDVLPRDTHLRHSVRIATRETLRDPAAWTALKAMKLDDDMVRLVSDLMPGLPTKDAADFLTAHLATLATDGGRLPAYVEHASRYGDGTKTVFAFVTKHKPDDLRLTVALFHAYERGLQQKGGMRFDQADLDFAEKLVTKGLQDANGPVVQSCLDIAAAMKLKTCAEPVRALAMRRQRPDALRAAAFTTLLAIDPAAGVPLVGSVLADAGERVEVRERAAQALAGTASPEAYTQLVAALEKAPARLQTTIALAVAPNPVGAKHLLDAVAAGKASARLLQERAVQARLNESKLPMAAERVAELTKGLPSAEQKMIELMNQRRFGFAKSKPDAKLGAAVFKTHCANCHQLGGEGAKIGPQIDGVGVRGLDRLLEDILDPSRNVDQAMRTTVLNLKDGKTVSGLLIREEGEVFVLADSLGKEVRVPKNDVDDRRTSLLSPMPANLADAIKEEEFYHLMAFLLEQRPKDR
jgi:putative membrane-bound dehydrogenase-like protein